MKPLHVARVRNMPGGLYVCRGRSRAHDREWAVPESPRGPVVDLCFPFTEVARRGSGSIGKTRSGVRVSWWGDPTSGYVTSGWGGAFQSRGTEPPDRTRDYGDWLGDRTRGNRTRRDNAYVDTRRTLFQSCGPRGRGSRRGRGIRLWRVLLSGPVLPLLLGALVVQFCSGGMVRSISPIPRDATFRRVATATWWVSPALVTAAGAVAAWELRDQAPLPAVACAIVAASVAGACWVWRPQRAPNLWVPTLLLRLRTAVRTPIRDSAAWRRQLVCMVAGALFLIAG